MSRRKQRSQREISSRSSGKPLAPPPFSTLAMATLIVVATCAAYLPALRGGFILDDDDLLTENYPVQAPDGLHRIWFTTQLQDYYPLVYSAFWLEWRLWANHPLGYHVVNLAWHIASALLIWRILQMLAVPGAFLAALLFALHPANVESVAWIVQRRNVMALAFALLSVWAYLESGLAGGSQTKPTTRLAVHGWYAFSLLSFVLAMLSKASVAILPLTLLLIVWWQRRRIAVSDLARAAPFFLVAILFAEVNLWFQTHGAEVVIRPITFPQRLAGAGAVLWFYLSKAILPIDLVFVYPSWHIDAAQWIWWLPLLAAAFLTALLWWRRGARWGRPLFIAWVFIGVALAPVLGLTDVGFMRYSPVADHYQHIALVGAVALVAAACSVGLQQARRAFPYLAPLAAMPLAVAFFALTFQQCRLYANPITLYQHTLQANPDCWLIHNNLGNALLNSGQSQAAIEHYQRALALKPDCELAENNWGDALLKAGRFNDAIQHYQQALNLQPNYALAHCNLGIALFEAGRLPESIEHLQQSIQLKPENAKARYNLGNALEHAGRAPDAIQQYQQALKLEPGYAKARNNLGVALLRMGNYQAAMESFQETLRLDPNSAMACANVAMTYAHLNRPAEAIALSQRASDMARAQGNAPLANQIEAWLNDYRANPPSPGPRQTPADLSPSSL